MFKNKKVIVVMPAYNAAQIVKKTSDEVMEEEDGGAVRGSY